MFKKKVLGVLFFTLEVLIYQMIIITFLAVINLHKILRYQALTFAIIALLINFFHIQFVYIYLYKRSCFALKMLNLRINYNPNYTKLPPLYNFLSYYLISYALIVPPRLYYIFYAKMNYLFYKTEIYNFNIFYYIKDHLIYFNNSKDIEGFFTVQLMWMISSLIYFLIQLIRKNEKLTIGMKMASIDIIENSKSL